MRQIFSIIKDLVLRPSAVLARLENRISWGETWAVFVLSGLIVAVIGYPTIANDEAHIGWRPLVIGCLSTLMCVV